MQGDSAYAALASAARYVQRSLNCFTDGVVRPQLLRQPVFHDGNITLAETAAVRLRGARVPVALRVAQRYIVVHKPNEPRRRQFHVVVDGYWYSLEMPETEVEYLAFHWHPAVASKAFPHVHLEAGLGVQRAFVGAHVPTGPLLIEDVVRFAIEELDVRPRMADWEAVLGEGRAAAQAAGLLPWPGGG